MRRIPTRWVLRAMCAAVLLLSVPSRAIAPVPQQAVVRVPVRPRALLDGFDLRPDAAVQVALPRSLREVSGLAEAADGRLFAHDDERAIIRQIDRAGTVLSTFSLGARPARDDLEGLAIVGDRFFLITSTGRLYEAREGPNGASVRYLVRQTGFGAQCELEGLAFEPADRTLIIGCKRAYTPALRGLVTLFRWSVDRGAPATPPRLSVPLADAVRGTDAEQFHISAVERDPRTGHYLVIAGPQRLLAELTPAGTVVATRALAHRLHTQPEGITFVGDSILLIADEGGNARGTLTAYRRAQ